MVSSRSLWLEFQPAYCWTTLSSVVPFYDIQTINMYLLSTGNTSRSKDAESPSWCEFIFYYILFNKVLHKHHLFSIIILLLLFLVVNIIFYNLFNKFSSNCSSTISNLILLPSKYHVNTFFIFLLKITRLIFIMSNTNKYWERYT